MRTYVSHAIYGAVTVYPAKEQSVKEVFGNFEAYAHDNSNKDLIKPLS
jgi:hypothetical protein